MSQGEVVPDLGGAQMMQRSDSFTPPEWTKPGNRWGPWLYWPMLCIGVTLLVWRVSNHASMGQIVSAAAQTLVWACLLTVNRRARRRQRNQ